MVDIRWVAIWMTFVLSSCRGTGTVWGKPNSINNDIAQYSDSLQDLDFVDNLCFYMISESTGNMHQWIL